MVPLGFKYPHELGFLEEYRYSKCRKGVILWV
jgi:hypothetical protein